MTMPPGAAMTHRERALAAMRGEPVDHIPFIARMDMWYSFHRNAGTLPAPYQSASLWDIQRDLGVGLFGFGAWDISFYRLIYRDVAISQSTAGQITTTQYATPYGTLTARDKMAAELHGAAGTGARVEYPFKTAADFDALQFLIEHADVVENYAAYARFADAIGEDGLALPYAGWLPAHQLMIWYMGYATFYYALHDHPACVEALIAALTDQYRRVLSLAVHAPAPAIEVGANYDEQMTPPPVFERFFAPCYHEAAEILRPAGKIIVVHGDGEMKRLLQQLMDCGVQVVEALTPRPMTSIDIARTRQLWADQVCMWGGLATVMLTDVFSDDQFEQFMEALFRAVAPGDRFILGFGDNVPTDALFHRIRRAVTFWQANGACPLQT